MSSMNWTVQAKRADFYALSEQYNIDPVTARLIINRDVPTDSFEEYLSPDISGLHDPFLMEDMQRAVNVIVHDIEEGHRIRIVGDYDVDGIMSTYILYCGLLKIGAEVDYLIPHRIKDGYGINTSIIEKAHEDGIHTVLTCDNGITAFAALDRAAELGLTVLVTDHHELNARTEGGPKELPKAEAILDAKRDTDTYPFRELCGAGVAYKFLTAIYMKREIPVSELYEYIQFVAMATVCDLVPLKDENRIFTSVGLKDLNETSNKGLRALIGANELSDHKITTYHIGFRLGPCLNATGKIDSADMAMELLLTEDAALAIERAQAIVETNRLRQELTEEGVKKALDLLERRSSEPDKVSVIYIRDIHEGVAGIIAGRVKEITGRPTIVLADSDEEGLVKGSARSAGAYNMHDALAECDSLLVKWGGHAMAAGLTLEASKVDEFSKKINENCKLTDEDFEPSVKVDVMMPISYIREDLITEFERLEPFGMGNEKPIFGLKDVNIQSLRILGKERKVAKMVVESEDGTIGEAVYFDVDRFCSDIIGWFGQEEYDKLLQGWLNNVRLNIAYYPQVNEFNGKKTIQLKVEKYDMATVREVL